MLLLIKIIIAVLIGALFGYLYRVFSRRRLGTQFEVAKGKFVQVDGLNVHYIQEGLGPDLLLVHGIGASIFCWRRIFGKLTKKYRVTAIDLPGFGQSDKDSELDYGLDAQTKRLARIIETLKLEPCFIVGCSMGGALALWLQKERPDLVRKAAVIGPAAHREIVFINTRKLEPLVRLIGHRLVTPYIIEKIYRRIVTNQNLVTATAIDQAFRPYAENRETVMCFWKAHETLRDARLPQSLREIKGEVLVLYGQADRAVRRRYIDDILANLERGSLLLHPSGGHHLMEDEPDFVTENLQLFLGSTSEKSV